jgi:hypothetical protein
MSLRQNWGTRLYPAPADFQMGGLPTRGFEWHNGLLTLF